MFFRIEILKVLKFRDWNFSFFVIECEIIEKPKKNVRFEQCLNFWLLLWRNKFLFREKKAFFPSDFFDIPSHRPLYVFLLSQKTDHTNGGDHTNDGSDHTNDGSLEFWILTYFSRQIFLNTNYWESGRKTSDSTMSKFLTANIK